MLQRPLYRNLEFTENFDAIQDLDGIKALVDVLGESDNTIGFDIETGYSGTDYPKRATNTYNPLQFISGFSITNDPTWARYVPLRHDFATNLDPNVVWPLLKPVLESKNIVAHNLAFEAENLINLERKGDGPNIDLFKGGAEDSMIQAFVLADVPPMYLDGAIENGEFVKSYIPPFHRTPDNFMSRENRRFLVGLKSLTLFRYNYHQADIFSLFNGGKELTAKQKELIRFNTLPVNPSVVHYACDDAYLALQLHLDQSERIKEDAGISRVYKMEMAICEILVEIRENGISVDWDFINKNKNMKEEFIHELQVKTHRKFEEESGREWPGLNLGSVVQLRKILYTPKEEGGLGLTTTRVTGKGDPSTDADTLEELEKDSEAVTTLMTTRRAVKMGQWFEQWAALQDDSYDNKIHPSFMQTRNAAGRFASASPNVQQLTKHWYFSSKEGSVAEVMRTGEPGIDFWTGSARDAIIASPGYKLLSFDYKSAEIQFVAALAGEGSIIEAFRRGDDFHKWAASLMYNKDIEDVTPAERQAAKAFAFGSIFGQSVSSLAEKLHVTRDAAQHMQDLYFAAFPNLGAFFEKQKKMAEDKGSVWTWMGRKVTLWERMSPDPKVRNKAKRLAVNAVVQGGATGDYTKVAMIRVRDTLKEKGLWGTKVRLLMNQHDSLVFEYAEDLNVVELIETLTASVSFDLKGIKGFYDYFEDFPPMSVDWEEGYKWGSIEDVGSPDYSKSKECIITLNVGGASPKADLPHINDVVATNPGDIPVRLVLGEESVTLKSKISPTYKVMKKLKNGDPDIGISTKLSEFTTVEFV